MNETLKKIRCILDEPPFNGRQRELARVVGLDISQLHRVLHSTSLPSPRVVARIAAKIPEGEAHDLIAGYLQEAARTVAAEVKTEGAKARKWASKARATKSSGPNRSVRSTKRVDSFNEAVRVTVICDGAVSPPNIFVPIQSPRGSRE